MIRRLDVNTIEAENLSILLGNLQVARREFSVALQMALASRQFDPKYVKVKRFDPNENYIEIEIPDNERDGRPYDSTQEAAQPSGS